MEAVTVLDLGPIIAAVLGPMLVFVAVSMRYQHNDSTKTRELTRSLILASRKENCELIERSRKENCELIERSSKENCELIERSRKENRELIERSSKENRELIERSSKENCELIERSRKENRELIERVADRLSAESAEHRQLAERRHQEIIRSLGDARERLSRIEGHLRIGAPPPHENETGEESDRAA